MKLKGITLDNTRGGRSEYPGGYALYRSVDGTTFESTPFATGSGSYEATVVSFPQQTFRAIKIAQTGKTNRYERFSIGELQANCSM